MTRIPRRLIWALQPVAIGLVLWLALGGTQRDVRAPLVFSGDGLVTLAEARWIMTHGAWAGPGSNPIPDAGSLPLRARIDRAAISVAHLFSRRVPAVVTMAWALMLMVGGASAAWCLRSLGVSVPGAWSVGVLFAFCPFALFHHTANLSLMPYLVPFAATAALQLASGRWATADRRVRIALVAGTALLGFNLVFHALFAAFFIVIGAIAGFVRTRERHSLVVGAAILAALVVTSVVNLTSTRASSPPDYGAGGGLTHPTHAEAFGLKIRHLVSPLPGHWFPPFRAWAARDAQSRFPDEPEPAGARLGLIAVVGFLGLVTVLLSPGAAGTGRESETIRSAARLTFAAVALATVGGFGAVLNLLVPANAPVYARITPFVAFFSLAALALAVDRMTLARDRWRGTTWAGLLIVGLLDQSVAFRPLEAKRAAIDIEFRALREFLSGLEQRLPAGALVMQLPIRPYPVDRGIAHMRPYDHFKPGVISGVLRWSYPAVSADEVRRQAEAAAVESRDLPAHLARQGFSAILVDKLGYPDQGAAILAALQAGALPAQPWIQDDRYVALCLAKCQE